MVYYSIIIIIYNKGVSMLDSRIETFLCLCETRSYTKTAGILNITQPTVTQHIQYLENKYKSSLVTYSGKVLKITEKGNELKKMALAMKANNLKIEHFMLSEYDKDKDINFGSTLTIGEYVMPDKIAEYLSKHPKINLTMLVDNTQILLKALEEGNIDFAVIEGFFAKEKYNYQLLKKAEFIVVCNNGNPLTDSEVTLEDLLKQRLIVREKGSGTRDILETILHEKNFSIQSFQSRIEIGNFNAIKELVRKDLGITFVYREVVQKELNEGILKQIKLKDFNICREFNIVYLKEDVLVESYRDFWNFIRE
jgi:DNA-binding transcriptional LysR family regulator